MTNDSDTSKVLGYDVHPACSMLPLMSDDSLEELAADIKANGLNKPIVLVNGKLLDGRNRLLACDRAGVEARFEDYEGDDPVGWALSLNFHRRHLTDTQKALVGAKAERLLMARVAASLPQASSETPPAEEAPAADATPAEAQAADDAAPPKPAQVAKQVRRTAAALVNVSERAIARGKKLIDKAVPELVQAVEVGTVPLTAASTVAELEPPRQREVIAEGPAMVKAEAKRMREEKRATRPPSITAALKILDGSCPDYVIEKTREGRFVFKATVMEDGDEKVIETEAFTLRDLLVQAVQDAPAL